MCYHLASTCILAEIHFCLKNHCRYCQVSGLDFPNNSKMVLFFMRNRIFILFFLSPPQFEGYGKNNHLSLSPHRIRMDAFSSELSATFRPKFSVFGGFGMGTRPHLHLAQTENCALFFQRITPYHFFRFGNIGKNRQLWTEKSRDRELE